MSFDDLIQKLPSARRVKEVQEQVAEVVKQLSEEATRFADRYRMRGPVLTVGVKEDPRTWEELLQMLTAHGHRFAITKLQDIWDIYHCETPSLSNFFSREGEKWKRIQACRMDVKILFLQNAKTIFTAYFEHISEFLENAPKEISKADAVIRELQELLKPVEKP